MMSTPYRFPPLAFGSQMTAPGAVAAAIRCGWTPEQVAARMLADYADGAPARV